MEDDLADALCASKKQARCVILSGAPSKNPSLVRNLINLDSKLLHALGGTRGSLATRVADWVVQGVSPENFPSKIRESIDALTAKQPARKVYNRQPLTDEEVKLLSGFNWRRIRASLPAEPCGFYATMIRPASKSDLVLYFVKLKKEN